MIKIHYGNSYSQITGLNPQQFKELRKLLSYQTDPSTAYFSRGYNRTKYLLDKKGYFPTGLLKRVTTYIKPDQITGYNVFAARAPKPLVADFGFTPYEAQRMAVYNACKANRGGIVMPTGVGKSLVIGMLINQFKLKTLVIVPNVEIRNQLEKDLVRWFNRPQYITVRNIDASDLPQQTDYDMLILDECHHAAAKTYQNLNKKAWTNIPYRFFLTATYFRNQQNEQLLFEGIAGDVIYSLTPQDAIKAGYIVPVEAYYYDLPKTPTDAYTWREVYSELVVNHEARNAYIAGMLHQLQLHNKSTLCLVKEVAHGQKLSDLSGVPFANGKDEESRKYIQQFKDGKITCLIGTAGILGEGTDTKPAEYIIIAGLGKAKSTLLQWIGRGVRKFKGKDSCKVILLRDTSHKFTLRHFNHQVKVIKEVYGVKAMKLE